MISKSKNALFITSLACFFLSGLAGLAYQSIWSKYLALLLGNAAYAQSLVLMIFMGGLALGAWLAARFSSRIHNSLRLYALIEFVIGLFGMGFHFAFTHASDALLNRVFPALDSHMLVVAVQWLAGGLLIFPQTILLGATFPLMNAAWVRSRPGVAGNTISWMYAVNSMGASLGALWTVFYLVPHAGLPGTLLATSSINILIAALLWLLGKREIYQAAPLPAVTDNPAKPAARPLLSVVLVASAVTGLASFIYEIVWVRLLNLTLGSTIHTFELMLSAFIAGIALGGYWIRRRIDAYEHPLWQAGLVQVAMGLFAVFTLWGFGLAIDSVGWIYHATSRSAAGYDLYLLFSSTMALAIMLPTTFFAGMTLPLFTQALLRSGTGERAIGWVYASNTIGAILGVLFAVHLALPLLGAGHALLIGAILDIGLGIFLITRVPARKNHRILFTGGGLAVLAIVGTLIAAPLNPKKLSSGAFRNGQSIPAPSNELVYYRDGKTATVTVVKGSLGTQFIATNGKIDAAMALDLENPPTSDEYTMVGLAAIPLAMRPDARIAAVIGFGSGLTAHSLLASPKLQRLDMVEIEPAMIDGARTFGSRVKRAFDDPRMHIHVDDARTFFATSKQRYDVIVSEPSNPWVNGVSALFTDEFYAQIRTHIRRNGLLIQWLQLYEIDQDLVFSVLRALDNNMADYAVYLADSVDLIIVASPFGAGLPVAGDELFSWPGLKKELARLDIASAADLNGRLVFTRSSARALLHQPGIVANSDYFPILEYRAPAMRFARLDAREIPAFNSPHLPLHTLFTDAQHRILDTQTKAMTTSTTVPLSLNNAAARRIITWLNGDQSVTDNVPSDAIIAFRCPGELPLSFWRSTVNRIAQTTIPVLDQPTATALWNPQRWQACPHLGDRQHEELEIYADIAKRRFARVYQGVAQLFKREGPAGQRFSSYWVDAAMWAALMDGNPNRALQINKDFGYRQWRDPIHGLTRKLLLANAKSRLARSGSVAPGQQRGSQPQDHLHHDEPEPGLDGHGDAGLHVNAHKAEVSGG